MNEFMMLFSADNPLITCPLQYSPSNLHGVLAFLTKNLANEKRLPTEKVWFQGFNHALKTLV